MPKKAHSKKKSLSRKRKASPKKAKSVKSKKTKRTKITKTKIAKKTRKQSTLSDVTRDRRIAGSDSGKQSGDFQGLHNSERADSESVEELLEEGNTFEAGAVAGVEQADDAEEREVRTRELPEDDVPEEYLDKD